MESGLNSIETRFEMVDNRMDLLEASIGLIGGKLDTVVSMLAGIKYVKSFLIH